MKRIRLILPPAMLALAGVVVMAQNPAAPTAPEGEVATEATAPTDFPPKKFEPRRYDAIFEKNPFMQEVVPVEEEAEDDPWADGLELKAVSRIGGKYVVHVENTKLAGDEDREKRKMAYHRLVEGDQDDVLRIQTVKPHRDPSQVEVVVATGAGPRLKTATITYSEKQLNTKATPQVRPPQPGQPNAAPTRTARPQPTTPNTNRPRATPGRRRVILPPGLPASTPR